MIRSAAVVCGLLLGLAPLAFAQKFGDGPKRYHRDRLQDVRHLALNLTIDPEKGTVVGTSTLELTLLRPTDAIMLDAGSMQISRVVVTRGDKGLEVPFTHQKNQLRVDVPGTLPPGTALAVAIEYEATPKRGMFFIRPDKAYPDRTTQVWTQGEAEENRYWFPGYDYPDDRFTSEVRIKVRKPLSVLSNGRLLGTVDDGDYRVHHWKMDTPHVSYLMMLAIGEFERHEILGHSVPMHVWLTARDAPHWKRSFERTAEVIGFIEDYTQVKYPWAKYDQVVVDDFMWGGMENTTATTITNTTIHDERAAPEFSSVALVVHEAAHQWFGNLITCRSWSHLWLNEGFATYLETLWFEAKDGRARADWDRLGSLWWYLDEAYRRPLVESRYAHPDDLFDGHTYAKGAWVLHMLRVRLGDAAFQKGVQHYLKKHRQSVVESEDLRRALEEATGARLADFFDQWVYTKGHPVVETITTWNPDTREVRLKLEQTTRKPWSFTLPITLHGAFGTQKHRVSVDQRVHNFSWVVPSSPERVEIDPAGELLMELTTDQPLRTLIAQARRGSTMIARYRACHDLGERNGDDEVTKTVEALVAVLGDDAEFPEVRATAAGSLSTVGGTAAQTALLAALTDPKHRVRRAAAEALGSFEGENVAEALERVFEEDPGYRVAAQALTSYVQLASKDDALSLLDDAMDRASHREVIRKAALSGLLEIGGSKAFERIVKATQWGVPDAARQKAARVLGSLGKKESKLRKKALTRLVELLEDKRYWTRHAAIEGLERLGDKGAKRALRRMSQGAATRHLRRAATKALARLDKKSQSEDSAALKRKIKSLRHRTLELEERLLELEQR